MVLIQGTTEALLKVHCSIVEKVYDFPVPKDLAVMIGDRPKQVRNELNCLISLKETLQNALQSITFFEIFVILQV